MNVPCAQCPSSEKPRIGMVCKSCEMSQLNPGTERVPSPFHLPRPALFVLHSHGICGLGWATSAWEIPCGRSGSLLSVLLPWNVFCLRGYPCSSVSADCLTQPRTPRGLGQHRAGVRCRASWVAGHFADFPRCRGQLSDIVRHQEGAARV